MGRPAPLGRFGRAASCLEVSGGQRRSSFRQNCTDMACRACRANGILTNDPACKLEIECPRQAAVDASLQLLRPALSRQVTEELLARTTDIGDDEDSDEGEDGFDDGDTFSNLALRKVAREVLSRAESSRLDILKPLREAQPAEMNAVRATLLST